MGASGIGAVPDRMRSGEIYEAAVVDAETQGFAAGSRGFSAETLRFGVGREDRALRERDARRVCAPRRTNQSRTGCTALAPTRAQLASIYDRGRYERDSAQYSGRTATGPAQGLSTRQHHSYSVTRSRRPWVRRRNGQHGTLAKARIASI